MKAVSDLPPELLIHTFKFLPRSDWRSIEQVCQKWRKLIAVHFWRRHIQRLVQSDGHLPILLEELGWSADCIDFEVIRSVWQKLNNNQRWEYAPLLRENMMYQYSPNVGSKMKVSECALHKNKIFISLIGGNVQSRSLDDFRLLNVLRDAPVDYINEEPILLATPLGIHQDVLVIAVASEGALHVWNADTEEQVRTLRLPRSISKVYDVKVNGTHIVCLSGWSVVAWHYTGNVQFFSLVYPEPVVAQDMSEQAAVGEVNIWFETHNIEMNEEHVVTHVSQPLVSSVFRNPNGPETKSFLHCRSLLRMPDILGPSIKLNPVDVEHMEIEKIRLSSSQYNVMALMHTDETVSPMCFAVRLMSIPSGMILANVFSNRSSLNSEVRMPIQWVDNRLYMKLVPKFSILAAREECDVTMSMWNYETNDEVYMDHVSIASLTDCIMIDNAKVVQVFHRLSPMTNRDQLSHQICGKLYDYWNNDI